MSFHFYFYYLSRIYKNKFIFYRIITTVIIITVVKHCCHCMTKVAQRVILIAFVALINNQHTTATIQSKAKDDINMENKIPKKKGNFWERRKLTLKNKVQSVAVKQVEN